MYSIDKIKKAIRNPDRIPVELNRLYHRKISRESQKRYENASCIFEEQWDNLILLDACTYEAFVETNDLPGETYYRISLGSTTREFVRKNFRNRKLYDIVYVSANGWFEKLRDEINSDVYRFDYTERDVENGLTTHPSTVTERTLELYNIHPDKRFIIHYLQPHQPYIGETGEKIEHNEDLYTTMRSNDVSLEILRKAYRENLEIALDNLFELLDNLEGTTVISSDHGELLGNRLGPLPVRDFGHPVGVYTNDLIKVPWHVYTNGQRETTAATGPYQKCQGSMQNVKEHLADLGYQV